MKYLFLLAMSIISISVSSQIIDKGSDVIIQNVILNNGASFSNSKSSASLLIGSSVSSDDPVGDVVIKKGSTVNIGAVKMKMGEGVYMEDGANFKLNGRGVPVGNKSILKSQAVDEDFKFYWGTDHEGLLLNERLGIGGNDNYVINGLSWGNFSIGNYNTGFMIDSNSGNVGIGVVFYDFQQHHQYKLMVNGDASASRFLTTSDARLKSDIKPIRNCTKNLLQLSAKVYDKKSGDKQSREIGLIAQDVVNVFPEVVSDNNSGYLSIDYMEMVPLIIETIKEQQMLIENNQNNIDRLEMKKAM